ncbi:hypothetical protein TREES_T100007262 [Tupaia chinensis]|uniref:Uncharacterized protein n=1 Tax=Tupaia chinensis TaxID=246437 RepID=L9L104_TUPCH|nr:hypothetical protein TREES_T100007262 [Tupaia chinensis]
MARMRRRAAKHEVRSNEVTKAANYWFSSLPPSGSGLREFRFIKCEKPAKRAESLEILKAERMRLHQMMLPTRTAQACFENCYLSFLPMFPPSSRLPPRPLRPPSQQHLERQAGLWRGGWLAALHGWLLIPTGFTVDPPLLVTAALPGYIFIHSQWYNEGNLAPSEREPKFMLLSLGGFNAGQQLGRSAYPEV